MWGNKLIGGLGDQLGHIVWSYISNKPFNISFEYLANSSIYQTYFLSQLYPWSSSEPLIRLLTSFFSSIFGPNFFNIFLVITLGLNLYFSYLLFKRFKYSWFYIIIFNFSSYFWIHFGEHLELSQTWIYCLLIKMLLDKFWLVHPYKFGLFLSSFVLISNYIGFFSLVFFLIYLLVYWGFNKTNIGLKLYFLAITKITITFLVSIFIFIYPYIKANVYKISYDSSSRITGSKTVIRSLGDYITFSSRPWYFLIPSTSNPLLGIYSNSAYELIKSSGNYLTDDYFPREHSANYFGLSFLIVFMYLLIKEYKKKNLPYKTTINILLVSSIVVFIFMMPPVLTIKNIILYNISYIFYILVPVFRVTARMSVLLHLLLLLSFGYLLHSYIHKQLKYILFILMSLVLIETYIPLKVYTINVPPIYQYIGVNYLPGNNLVVYPYDKTKEALLFLSTHNQLVVNPRGYNYGGFDSESFTVSLLSDTSTIYSKLVSINTNYLVTFGHSYIDVPNINLIHTFGDSALYEIIY